MPGNGWTSGLTDGARAGQCPSPCPESCIRPAACTPIRLSGPRRRGAQIRCPAPIRPVLSWVSVVFTPRAGDGHARPDRVRRPIGMGLASAAKPVRSAGIRNQVFVKNLVSWLPHPLHPPGVGLRVRVPDLALVGHQDGRQGHGAGGGWARET
jgi:hypothetical protein